MCLSIEPMADEISVLKNTIDELTQRIKKLEDASKTKSFIYLKDEKTKSTVTIDILETNCINITPLRLIFSNIYDNNYEKNINYKSVLDGRIYRDISEYLIKIEYLTNLKFIAIHGITLPAIWKPSYYDVDIRSLPFLGKNTEILSITLHNLSTLENIDQIVNLENLKNIKIINCPNIKNLKILEKCIGLIKLTVKPPINLNGILLPSVEIVVL